MGCHSPYQTGRWYLILLACSLMPTIQLQMQAVRMDMLKLPHMIKEFVTCAKMQQRQIMYSLKPNISNSHLYYCQDIHSFSSFFLLIFFN